jgi:hypothetical protein
MANSIKSAAVGVGTTPLLAGSMECEIQSETKIPSLEFQNLTHHQLSTLSEQFLSKANL